MQAAGETAEARARRALLRGGVARAGAAGPSERLVVAAGGTAAIAMGLLRRSPLGLGLAAAGGAAAYRGLAGGQVVDRMFGFAAPPGIGETIAVERSIRVLRPAAELFGFWREVSNHPRFVAGLRSVQELEGRRYRWTVETVAGRTVSWEAEMTEERAPELISWRAGRGTGLEQVGRVEFLPAPREETEVRVAVDVAPPWRLARGTLAAIITGEAANRWVSEQLRRFKQLMEAGEIATIAGQPAGRRSPLGRALSGTVQGRDRR